MSSFIWLITKHKLCSNYKRLKCVFLYFLHLFSSFRCIAWNSEENHVTIILILLPQAIALIWRDQSRHRINVAVALTCQIHVTAGGFSTAGMNTSPPPTFFTSYFHVTSMCSLASALSEIESVRRHRGVSGRREREKRHVRKKERRTGVEPRRRSSSLIGVRRRPAHRGWNPRLPSSSSTDFLLRDRLRASLYRIFDWRHARKKRLTLEVKKKTERERDWTSCTFLLFAKLETSAF